MSAYGTSVGKETSEPGSLMRYHGELQPLHESCQKEAQVNEEELGRLVGQPVLYGVVRSPLSELLDLRKLRTALQRPEYPSDCIALRHQARCFCHVVHSRRL